MMLLPVLFLAQRWCDAIEKVKCAMTLAVAAAQIRQELQQSTAIEFCCLWRFKHRPRISEQSGRSKKILADPRISKRTTRTKQRIKQTQPLFFAALPSAEPAERNTKSSCSVFRLSASLRSSYKHSMPLVLTNMDSPYGRPASFRLSWGDHGPLKSPTDSGVTPTVPSLSWFLKVNKKKTFLLKNQCYYSTMRMLIRSNRPAIATRATTPLIANAGRSVDMRAKGQFAAVSRLNAP